MDQTPRLDPALIGVLRARLPEVANHTIAAVTEEVPAYAVPFGGPMGATIEQAVQMALAGFLRLANREQPVGTGSPLSPALEGAYALGRGEARSGRSADALLSAYRVGARVAWRELAATAVEQGADAESLASFAEMVFAYIDELSAASVAGHADELETSGRVRQRYLDRLGQALLRGDSEAVLVAAAERADWSPPRMLTAVVLPEAQVRPLLGLVETPCLPVGEAVAGLPEGRSVVLVGGHTGRARAGLLRLLRDRSAVAGPPRPWTLVRSSYTRALRALPLLEPDTDVLDTEARLAELVLTADPEALADLRARALAPLAGLRPATQDKLADTLRAWLLHQGRREDVAEALFVHPQTVRYRMGQLREAYGARLEDPQAVLELVLALGVAPPVGV